MFSYAFVTLDIAILKESPNPTLTNLIVEIVIAVITWWWWWVWSEEVCQVHITHHNDGFQSSTLQTVGKSKAHCLTGSTCSSKSCTLKKKRDLDTF